MIEYCCCLGVRSGDMRVCYLLEYVVVNWCIF